MKGFSTVATVPFSYKVLALRKVITNVMMDEINKLVLFGLKTHGTRKMSVLQ
jgi:hypothetical protein